MNQDDRVEQALDDFWKCAKQWRNSYMKEGHDTFMIECVNLKRAYDAWLDASKPPGDPHKEWVDADKMKPECGNQLVLVRLSTYETPAIAFWVNSNKSWRVQQYRNDYFDTQTDVTHWRYIPKMED